MAGFFSRSHITKNVKQKKLARCGACGLHKHCNSPKMEATGKGERGILIVAEAPGKKEDQRGTPMVGKPGVLMRKTLKSHGIDLDRDCITINSVKCRPSPQRKPTDQEIEACRPFLWKEIEKHKPQLIIIAGGVGLDSFYKDRLGQAPGGINKWRGFATPDRKTGAWVAPVYHPSYVLHQVKQGSVATEKVFKLDMANALKYLDTPVPHFQEEKEHVRILTSVDEINRELLWVLKNHPDLVSFDYEGTGLKPEAKGHRIVSASMAWTGDDAISFPMHKEILPRFIKFLRNKRIRKAAHNAKHEERWSRVLLGTEVAGWAWDSMIAAHILDNRQGICSLKFQTMVRYGLLDYSSHIKPFLQAEGGANGFNQIDKIPLDELLLYGGIDSLAEHWLALHQIKEMSDMYGRDMAPWNTQLAEDGIG